MNFFFRYEEITVKEVTIAAPNAIEARNMILNGDINPIPFTTLKTSKQYENRIVHQYNRDIISIVMGVCRSANIVVGDDFDHSTAIATMNVRMNLINVFNRNILNEAIAYWLNCMEDTIWAEFGIWLSAIMDPKDHPGIEVIE